jgi:hypothetical protein
MKPHIPLLALWLAATALHAEPVSIFNGENLEGWRVQDAHYWSARNGVLVGESDAKKQNSVLWTEKEYGDFVLELEFRFSGDVDSGVFLRHVDDQIQIGVSRSLKRDVTGSPYIGSKGRYPVEAEGAELKEGDWNRMKITVKGPRYIVEINGKQVLDYESDTAVENGPVGLQVHAGIEMKVEFRDVKVEELAD